MNDLHDLFFLLFRYFFEDPKVQKFLEWAKYTYSPDEVVWSSLHHIGINKQFNTPGGYNGKTVSF